MKELTSFIYFYCCETFFPNPPRRGCSFWEGVTEVWRYLPIFMGQRDPEADSKELHDGHPARCGSSERRKRELGVRSFAPTSISSGLITKFRANHDLLQVRDKIRSRRDRVDRCSGLAKAVCLLDVFPDCGGPCNACLQIGRSNGVVVWLRELPASWLARFCFYAIVCRVCRSHVRPKRCNDGLHGRRTGSRAHRMTAVPMGVDLDPFQSAPAFDRLQTACSEEE